MSVVPQGDGDFLPDPDGPGGGTGGQPEWWLSLICFLVLGAVVAAMVIGGVFGSEEESEPDPPPQTLEQLQAQCPEGTHLSQTPMDYQGNYGLDCAPDP